MSLGFNQGCPGIRTKDGKHMALSSSCHNELGFRDAKSFTSMVCKLCTMPDAVTLSQLPRSVEDMVIHSQIVTNLDTQELAACLGLPTCMVTADYCRTLQHLDGELNLKFYQVYHDVRLG